MSNLPNIISLCRLPLALVFLHDSPLLRAIAILLAAITDGLDGFLARRYHLRTRLGTILDPLMDKFFVFFILSILFLENRIESWKIAVMLSRDFAILIFGAYLFITGALANYKLQAVWCGKITTVLQLLVLLAVTLSVDIPSNVYFSFPIFGIFALIEMYILRIPEEVRN